VETTRIHTQNSAYGMSHTGAVQTARTATTPIPGIATPGLIGAQLVHPGEVWYLSAKAEVKAETGCRFLRTFVPV